MILLLDNYDSFTYNLYQYLGELGFVCKVVRNDQISISEIRELKPKMLLISPGPGNPDQSGISLTAVKELAGEIPILGICLGHQIIGQVFGGRVVRAKKPIHGKISKIFHNNQGIYADLPNPFSGVRYHSLIVERESLPDCLEITSYTEDQVIMGVRHKTLPLEGIQFHPESILTAGGKTLLANFVKSYV